MGLPNIYFRSGKPDKLLEAMHYYGAWDVMGDWTTRAVEVEDWMDVPIAEATETSEER